MAFMYILNRVILCDYVSVYAPSQVNFSRLLLRQRRKFELEQNSSSQARGRNGCGGIYTRGED